MQGGEMVSSARTIRQYCSVCKATLDMRVVDTVQDHEVTWLKCPRCSGILPHMSSGDEDSPAQVVQQAAEQSGTEASPAAGFSEEERAAALDYDAGSTYEVGQVVYHRSMNKFGRVAEKTTLPGQRSAIRVVFEDDEEMTLREGV
jgi:hypothetical protein